ncbi:hypothetical protein DL765_008667 [Monosporascus sp. GIB2]|nr:hypothetical protein DL765_008667 [Monosporascus sp. GIB2]
MLASLLQSISDSSAESEGIAELVVTAIGTGGRHYLCWKTPSGSYRQHCHGLPSALECWLFPADGSTRDFETLQVILSGEDAFWASDKHGEIKSETPDPAQKLRRATTIYFGASSAERKRWTGHIAGASGDVERKRSSTFPSVMSGPNGIIRPPVKPQPNHARSFSADKPQRLSLVPLSVRQKTTKWATRPRSYDGLAAVKECPTPGLDDPSSRVSNQDQQIASPCTCSCHEDARGSRSPLRNSGEVPQEQSRPVYADAGIQTDDTLTHHYTKPRSHGHRDTTQTPYGHDRMASTASSAFIQETNWSKRTSYLTTITSPETYCPETLWHIPNPVIMGRMQDYFRSANYFLGDSLQPRDMG